MRAIIFMPHLKLKKKTILHKHNKLSIMIEISNTNNMYKSSNLVSVHSATLVN